MTATTDTVLERLRAAAQTGTYTRLHVSMGALDTVRALPVSSRGEDGFAEISGDHEPAVIGNLWVNGRGYAVHRDPTLPNKVAVFWGDDTLNSMVNLDTGDVFKFYKGQFPSYFKDMETVRADLERRYPGCVFTDAFVAAYANGSA